MRDVDAMVRETLRKEVEALKRDLAEARAQLAALRERVQNRDDYIGPLADRIRAAEQDAARVRDDLYDCTNELEEARALLARWDADARAVGLRQETIDDTRAFLRGDEARRCTCGWDARPDLRPFQTEHAPSCEIRRPCPSCGFFGQGHNPGCLRDEAPCTCKGWVEGFGIKRDETGHVPACPTRDEARRVYCPREIPEHQQEGCTCPRDEARRMHFYDEKAAVYVERDLAEARKLLARWMDGWRYPVVELLNDTRAFLAGGRMEEMNLPNNLGIVPARDEAPNSSSSVSSKPPHR